MIDFMQMECNKEWNHRGKGAGEGGEREERAHSLGAGGCNEDERTKEGDHQNFFSPERLLAAGRRRYGTPQF